MSLKTRAQEDFLRWLIDELLKLYGGEGEEQLEPDVQTLTGARAFGQGSVGAKGRRFTGRTSNLYRRPGQDLPTIMVDGRPVALGNTARRRPLRPRRAPGFAFVPYTPPLEDDMPYQPVLSLSMIERPVEVGISKLMPGFVGGPVAHLDLDMELYEETGEIRLIWIPDGYGLGLPENVVKLMKSRLYPGKTALIPWEDNALIFTHYPQERPYCVGYDDAGVYIASWPHWDTINPFASMNAGTIGADEQMSGTTIPMTIQRLVDGAWVTLGDIGPMGIGSISVGWQQHSFTDNVYAYQYRLGNASVIRITDANGASVRTEEEFSNTYIQRVINTVYSPGYHPDDHYIYETSANSEFAVIVQISGGLNYDPVEKRVGNFASAFGTDLIATTTTGEVYGSYREIGGPWQSDNRIYRVIPSAGSHVQEGALTTRFSFSFDSEIPEDEDATLSTSYVYDWSDRKASIIPYYNEWPWPPTPESRAEVARLNPYIYERTGQTLYPPEFAQPPNVEGKLANPTGPLGVESSILGLSWTSTNYTFDAFYATTLDAEGSPVERLYAVVIYQDGSAQRVAVSVDGVQVREWALLDFFPTSDGTLYFLDGTPWDGELWPSYHFAGLDWPFHDGVGYLRPFRARLRSSQDKAGAMFAAGAADAPITLFLDSDDHDA